MRTLFSGKAPVLAILLVGWALRLWDWGAFPLHPDEALYGYWARLIASGRDPALFSVYVDKPPLFVYSLAGAFRAFGLTVEASRFPNIAASFLSLPFLWGIANRYYGSRTAFWALLAYALSPFAILFAPTMFTDPFLVLWVLAAVWAIGHRRFCMAGVAGGLAYASKQQSVLFLPLVTGVLVLEAKRDWRKWLAFAAGLLPILAAVTWWDALRWSFRPSFWDRSITTYGGIRMETVVRWPEKVLGWLKMLGMVYASLPVDIALLAAFLWVSIGVLSVFKHRTDPALEAPGKGWGDGDQSEKFVVSPQDTPAEGSRLHNRRLVDLGLTAFFLLYMALHVVVNFQVWDRYLLGVVPLLALVLGRGIASVRRRWRPAVAVFLLAAMLWPLPSAMAGKLPVGGDHWLHEKVEETASYLAETMPPHAVLYHRWLGWYWDFYLYGRDVEERYYFDPGYLARNAEKVLPRPVYLVVPGWKKAAPLRDALERDGLSLRPMKRFYRDDGSLAFTVMEIERQQASATSSRRERVSGGDTP